MGNIWYLTGILVGAFFSLMLAAYVCLLPPKHPKSIPAIPFWVTLIPIFTNADQTELFRKYLQGPLHTHGAVKLFFAARWNVVVHRPRYLAAMFKHGGIYTKSGNYKKIPHSVLSQLLGDNIISSHGTRWKKYREIIQPGLQRTFEVELLARNAEILCDLVSDASGTCTGVKPVMIQGLLQRYTIANMGQVLLQTDFGTLTRPDAAIHKLQTRVKQQIFKPIFLAFPILDRLPIPSRNEARKTVERFKDELTASLSNSHAKSDLNCPSDLLGARLLHAAHSGQVDEQQFRDNLTIVYIAGQENPQLALISLLYLVAQYPTIQQRLWEEIMAKGETEPAFDHIQDLPYMTSVIYESLRMLPPLSQIVNRCTAEDVLLDNHIFIPKGMYMGYLGYSTHHDTDIWGPDADSFMPERWGEATESIQKFYRKRRTRGEFITFHGGSRACLGEKFAILELKVSLFALVRRFTWELDPTWPMRMTPAGPLFPSALRLIFTSRPKS